MTKPILYLDDHRGIAIPQDFAESIHHAIVFGVDEETWSILSEGPDHDLYWDAWYVVCDNALVVAGSSMDRYSIPSNVQDALVVARDADLEGNTKARDAVLATIPGLVRYSLYQDGALWLIPEGMELTDRGEWIWPAETCSTCDRAVEDCGGCEPSVTPDASTDVHDSSSSS
jgi:hypothetical protein